MAQQPETEGEIRKIPADTDEAPRPEPESKAGQKKPSLLKEKPGRRNIDLLKFTLDASMLGWCIFLMVLCIVFSLWNPENRLVQDGFEAFKLIVFTILGYIFGSKNSQNRE